MLPRYRADDIVVVSPSARIRKGDRVVVRTRAGEVMAKVKRKSHETVELQSLNLDHDDWTLAADEVEWMARIVCASQ